MKEPADINDYFHSSRRSTSIGAKILVLSLLGVIACSREKPDESYFPLPGRDATVVQSEEQAFVVDTVVTGLDSPWSMAFLPDGQMLIAERAGNLWVVANGQLSPQPAEGKVPAGLRDIEPHPRFKENGWIYLSYYVEPDEDSGGYTVLLRGRLKENTLMDEQELYTAGPFRESGNWYGSRIAFDHEDYLFFTVGIRGERENAQDLSSYAGKTMRLHDDGRIPSDNPFAETPDALPEIYSYGHRMHEGLACHPATGQIWSNEHGEKGGDEINIIRAGMNFGWPEATYSLNYDDTIISEDTLREGMEPPVHHWTPSIAPSGMAFVVGGRYPNWEGNLFSGSLVRRLLMRSVIEGDRVVREESLLENIGRLRSVRLAPDGFLYVMTEDNGLIIRLIPVE